jgi:hypothetical protein
MTRSIQETKRTLAVLKAVWMLQKTVKTGDKLDSVGMASNIDG